MVCLFGRATTSPSDQRLVLTPVSATGVDFGRLSRGEHPLSVALRLEATSTHCHQPDDATEHHEQDFPPHQLVQTPVDVQVIRTQPGAE